MSPEIIGLLGIVALMAILALGLPIAAATGIVGFVGIIGLRSWDIGLHVVGLMPFAWTWSAGLTVLPLFILLSNYAASSGLGKDIFEAASILTGRIRGSLALATVFGCAFFSAICGSSVATAVMMGQIAIPEMLSRGYKSSLATGAVAASGTLGILIPPSALLKLQKSLE